MDDLTPTPRFRIRERCAPDCTIPHRRFTWASVSNAFIPEPEPRRRPEYCRCTTTPIVELDVEEDERVIAWESIAKHPFFAECYGTDGSLLDAMLEKLGLFTSGRKPRADNPAWPFPGGAPTKPRA